MSLEEFRNITKQNLWSNYVHLLLTQSSHSQETIQNFGVYWIEAGHRIREQVSDDCLLVTLLRHILPIYKDNSVKLYRGENQERWELGKIGLAWTKNIDTAKMFASGLNSTPVGGVLLKGNFQPEAVISGPNAHSKYLGEDQFTIDPFCITNIEIIEKFSPCC